LGKEKSRKPCSNCGEEFIPDDCLKSGNFFVYIPLKQQLVDILKNPKLHDYMTNRDLTAQTIYVSDITSSLLYQQLVEKHHLSENDITLTWNTDGVPVFKSSSYSIWPIQCMVNELPPHLRSKNILMTGLWFGQTKPHMNTFLKPFVDECRHLENTGFVHKFERIQRKVFPLICSADSPARAIVKNCKQYNGKHGCDWCEHPGECVTRERGPPTRYYPVRDEPVLRTAKKQAQYAIKADETGEPVKGVKGISTIEGFPTFDTVKGFTPEYMHSVCQGVMRQLANLWLDSQNHVSDFYIGRQRAELDDRLTSISPPSEMSRAPRSLNDRKFWKASEWRAFMFYGLVILRGILPDIYLKHFFLFVYGVYNLMGDKIAHSKVDLAESCLRKFVRQMEALYGLSSCTFNVHQMTHLANGVRNCGPLWATSAFMFEANNHVLLQMFHGTQHVPKQISETFMLARRAQAIASQYFGDDTNPAVVAMFEKLTGANMRQKNARVLEDNVTGLGSGKPTTLTASQVVAVMQLTSLPVHNRSAIVFHRFVANHQLYTSESYQRAIRHHNFAVRVQHQELTYGNISGLYVVKPECGCSVPELQYCQCTTFNIVFVNVMKSTGQRLYQDTECQIQSDFVHEVVRDTRVLGLFPLVTSMRKCMTIKLRNRTFMCALPCRFYGD
jgi:hypothetical protein